VAGYAGRGASVLAQTTPTSSTEANLTACLLPCGELSPNRGLGKRRRTAAVTPIVMVLAGSEDKWFAVTGVEVEGD